MISASSSLPRRHRYHPVPSHLSLAILLKQRAHSQYHCSSPDDAKLVIHAARKGYLPYTTQRLSQAERSEIRPGDVYVWFGRGADALTGTPALERWTDGTLLLWTSSLGTGRTDAAIIVGHSWGPSRMKDEYLYYHEKRAGEVTPVSAGHSARFVSYV